MKSDIIYAPVITENLAILQVMVRLMYLRLLRVLIRFKLNKPLKKHLV